MTPALAESFKLPDARGAVIAGVLKNGPADKGGMKPATCWSRSRASRSTAAPSSTWWRRWSRASRRRWKDVRRQGQDVDLSVTVGRRPKPQAPRE